MTTPATRSEPALGARSAQLALAPVDLATFLAGHWDRSPLLVERDDPGRFDAVLSVPDVERMAGSSGTRAPAFRLVKDGAQLPPATYTEDVPWRPGTFSGTARPGAVAEEIDRGATFVAQALHVHWHPAAVFCRGLEMALGCPVQANAYWTPAAAQGFAVHHDTHDVMVLQVAGTKRWRVYEPALEAPLKHQRWIGDLHAGEPVMDFVLRPGDTLYLPRGWPHEAETSAEPSLHVTVGLHPPTRLDAVRDAVGACGDDVEFRRALDGGLPDDLLARLAAALGPDSVAARARRRFVLSRRPILPDQIAQLSRLRGLTVDSPVARRETVIADLEEATLVFEGREVAFPAHAREALEAIHGSEGPLTGAGLPGPLDDAGRLVLLRRLVREGYLRVL